MMPLLTFLRATEKYSLAILTGTAKLCGIMPLHIALIRSAKS